MAFTKKMKFLPSCNSNMIGMDNKASCFQGHPL